MKYAFLSFIFLMIALFCFGTDAVSATNSEATLYATSAAQRNVTLAFILLVGYYYTVWHFFGRDPIPKTIMPQYHAPSNVSAGTAYMLMNKHLWHTNATTATLLQMTANNFLTMIFHPKTNTFEFHRTDKAPSYSEENMYPLTMGNRPLIIKPNTPNEDIYGLNNSFEFVAKQQMDNIYASNHKLVWPVAGLFYLLLPFCFSVGAFFMLVQLFFSQTGNMVVIECLIVGFIVYSLSKGTLLRRLLFATPIACFLGGFVWLFCQDLYIAGLIFSSVFVITIFSYLMGRPTTKGTRLTEHLQGFKMFLSTTHIAAQETNMELLPYAVALDAPYDKQTHHLNNLVFQGIQLYAEKIHTEENKNRPFPFKRHKNTDIFSILINRRK